MAVIKEGGATPPKIKIPPPPKVPPVIVVPPPVPTKGIVVPPFMKNPIWKTVEFQNFVSLITTGKTKPQVQMPTSVQRPRFDTEVSVPLPPTNLRPTIRGDVSGLVNTEAVHVPASPLRSGSLPSLSDTDLPKNVRIQTSNFKPPSFITDLQGRAFSPGDISPTDVIFLEVATDKSASIPDRAKAAFAYFGMKALTLFNLPSLEIERFFTQTEDAALGHKVGSVFQALYSSATWAYLHYKNDAPWGQVRAYQLNADLNDKTADFMEKTVPYKAESIRNLRETASKYRLKASILTNEVDYANRQMNYAWQNFESAWSSGVPSTESMNIEAAVLRQWANLTGDTKVLEKANKLENQVQERRNYYTSRATIYEQDAYGIRDTNPQKAIDNMVKSIEFRMKADPLDNYGSYTWVREPQRFESFKRDIAYLELQLGRRLTEAEIDRVKESHVNPGTELFGQAIFDPLNLPIVDKALEATFSVLGKYVKPFVKVALLENTGLKAAFDPLVTNWLAKETRSSAAASVASKANNIFNRFAMGYNKVDDMANDLGRLSNYAEQMGSPDITAFRKEQLLKELQDTTDGAKNLTMSDMDILSGIATNPILKDSLPPSSWSDTFTKALETSRDDLLVAQRRFVENAMRSSGEEITEEIVENRAQELFKVALERAEDSRIGIKVMADIIQDAHLAPYAIHEGSSLMSDTLSGAISRNLRKFAGEAVQNTAEASTVFGKFMDNFAENAGYVFGNTPGKKSLAAKGAKALSNLVEASVEFGGFARGIWTNFVLSMNPRWVVQNMIDSTFRSLVYGGNLGEHLADLWLNMQDELADALGFVPVELSQSLSRQGLGFADNVSTRFLQLNWKPKFGIFSYFDYAYNMLREERSANVIAGALKGLGDNQLTRTLGVLSDGARSIPNGIQDYNTAIEFTLRLRKFHNTYFKLVEATEPAIMSGVLEGVSSNTRDILRFIWRASDGNAAKMSAMIDDMVKGSVGKGKESWSILIPPGLEKTLLGMDAEGQSLVIGSVKRQLRELLDETYRKAGRAPTAEEFGAFFDSFKQKLGDEAQAHISQSYGFREISRHANPNKEVAAIPDLVEMGGIAPEPRRNVELADAVRETQKLNVNAPFQDSKKVTAAWETTIAPYGTVERVSGSGILVSKENGVVKIKVGQDITKLKKGQLYSDIRDATIRVMGYQDEQFVKSTFRDVDDYAIYMKKFLEDPTDMLNKQEDKFVAFVNQLSDNPHYEEILRRTSPNPINYRSAEDNWILHSKFNPYLSEKDAARYRAKVEMLADGNMAHPPEYRLAALRENKANGKLGSLYANPNMSDNFKNLLRDFQKGTAINRAQLHQFGALRWPGFRRAKNLRRTELVNLYWKVMEDSFTAEAKFKETLFEAAMRSEDDARILLENFMQNPTDEFLKMSGVKPNWNDARTHIDSVTVSYRGRNHTFPADQSEIADTVYTFFYADNMKEVFQIADNPVKIDNTGKIADDIENFVQEWRKELDIPRDEAERWVRMLDADQADFVKRGRGTSEDYLAGFHQLDTPEGGRVIATPNGLIARLGGREDEVGRLSFYGFHARTPRQLAHESLPALLSDLDMTLGRRSNEAADDFASILTYLERQGFDAGELSVVKPGEYAELNAKLWNPATTKDELVKIKARMKEIDNILRPRADNAQQIADLEAKLAASNGSIEKRALRAQIAEARKQSVIVTTPRFNLDGKPMKKLQKAFEQYMATGNAPDVILQKPFYNMKERLVDIYRKMDGTGLTEHMVPEVTEVMNNLRRSVDDSLEIATERKNLLLKRYGGVENIPDEDLFRVAIEKTGAKTDALLNSLTSRPLDSTILTSLTSKERSRAGALLARIEELANEEVINSYRRVFSLGENRPLLLNTTREIEFARLSNELDTLLDAATRRSNSPILIGAEREKTIEKILKYNKDLTKESLDELTGKELSVMAGKIDQEVADNWRAQKGILRKVMSQSVGKIDDASRVTMARNLVKKYTDVSQEALDALLDDEVMAMADRVLDAARKSGESPLLKLSAVRDIPVIGSALDNAALGRGLRKAGDVPMSFSELSAAEKQLLINRVAGKAPSTALADEIQAAWETWSSNTAMIGLFPEDAMRSPDALRTYLERAMRSNQNELAGAYQRWLHKLNEFEQSIMDLYDKKYKKKVAPSIPEAMIDEGVKTWIAKRDGILNHYDHALRAMDLWKDYMVKAAEQGGTNKLWRLSQAQADELTAIKSTAVSAKANMVADIIEKATKNTNDIMLDYEYTNITDQFMRNIFPFWKFPSRSLPFWAKTMAMHPELIAGYEKVQRYSRSQLRQAGAITSKGEILPSMEGYVRVPGTEDMWFNPLAPLSFRYVLDAVSKASPYSLGAYAQQEEMEPLAFLFKSAMDGVQPFGFSPAPWATAMAQFMGVPKEAAPPWPLIPQISLIPRHWVSNAIAFTRLQSVANMLTGGRLNIQEFVNPERQGADYLVENRMLTDVLAKVQNGNLTTAEGNALVREVEQAITEGRSNPLWQQTHQTMNNEESTRNLLSYFTGLYAKPFTDDQAALLELRDHNKLLKSALNNMFQAQIWDIPTDPYDSNQYYIDNRSTPEAWVNRLRGDIGWVTNEQGQLVTQGDERHHFLAQRITDYYKDQAYFEKRDAIYQEFNDQLRSIPVGSKYDERKPVYDWLDKELSSLGPSPYSRTFGRNVNVQLIEDEIRQRFIRYVVSTQPVWNYEKTGEKYQDYQKRVDEWKETIPDYYANDRFMKMFRENVISDIMDSLRSDQTIDASFWNNLRSELSTKGIDSMERSTDDIFSAMNTAYRVSYSDPYYAAVTDADGNFLSGYAQQLAEEQFAQTHQIPTAEDLYNTLQSIPEYKDKFTLAEVRKWTEDSGVYSIEEATYAVKDEDYRTRQDIWKVTSMAGPGKGYTAMSDAIATTVLDMGLADEIGTDLFQRWMDSGGNLYLKDPDKLKLVNEVFSNAAQRMNWTPPKGDELKAMATAQAQAEEFRKLVAEQLGEQFADYQGYYYDISYDAQKAFKKENPELYKQITGKGYGSYSYLRNLFAKYNPEYSKYYLGKEITTLPTTPLETALPTGISQNGVSPAYTPNTISTGPRGIDTGETRVVPSQNAPQDIRYPRGMISTIGSSLQGEIDGLLHSGAPLSGDAIEFLKNLAKRHPEWRLFIADVLSRNTQMSK